MALSLAPLMLRVFGTSLKAQNLSKEDSALLQALSSVNEIDEPTAYAVLLVDLARCDGHFDERESDAISKVLASRFRLAPRDTAKLVQTALSFLKAVRSSSPSIEVIKEIYSPDERTALVGMIDAVVGADGAEHASEKALQAKLHALL